MAGDRAQPRVGVKDSLADDLIHFSLSPQAGVRTRAPRGPIFWTGLTGRVMKMGKTPVSLSLGAHLTTIFTG